MAEALIMKTLMMGPILLALITMLPGPAQTWQSTSLAVQGNGEQVFAPTEVPLQGHWHMMLAGATVRDHRSNKGGTTGNWSEANVTPPPQSPGFGEGGVGHSVWSNSRDHRRCHTVVFNGQTGTICQSGK